MKNVCGPLAVSVLALSFEVFGQLPSSSFNKAVVPIYLDDQVVMVMSVERTRTDYQRKGFFKIGLLPILVAEGVTFEVQEPAKLTAALGRVPAVPGAS